MAHDDTHGFYFKQLLSGRDFATDDPLAAQMMNFCYAIGDRNTGECLLVDPAYDPAGLIEAVGNDGMKVTGVLATHYHADHVGGSLFGHSIVGIAELLNELSCPIHLQADEVPWVTKTTGVGTDHLVAHHSGDKVSVGSVDIELVHTPGHTPGSQCFLVRDQLVSGDTLFLDGCGRTDLPGSDHGQMLQSLARLAKMDDHITLFPGHKYSAASYANMATVKRSNFVLADVMGEH